MKFYYNLILIVILIAVGSCVRTDEFSVNEAYFTSAEKLNKNGDKFLAENDSSVFFEGGKLRTNSVAYRGDYAVYTIPKKAFVFSYRIKNAGPDWYFKISVWRKSKNDKGVLVAASKNAKEFYKATSTPVEISKDGWEKLEMEVYTPPTFDYSELNFYVWNNSSDTIYFDDFSIERLSGKVYPNYNEQTLAIMLDSSEYLKLYDKRKSAFEVGILQTEDDDWVKALVFVI